MLVLSFFVNAAAIALCYCRLHLMTRNPGAYERFHRAEKAFAKRQVEATERAARGLVAVIKALVRRLGQKFKKL